MTDIVFAPFQFRVMAREFLQRLITRADHPEVVLPDAIVHCSSAVTAYPSMRELFLPLNVILKFVFAIQNQLG